MSIEQEYKSIDFPQFSKVKESLRQRLHAVRRQNMAAQPIGIINMPKRELNWDELDYMAAAGTAQHKPEDFDD